MGTHTVRDVTGKLPDIYALRQLYDFHKRYLDIREIKYLRDFSMLETSAMTINPKFIIGDILKMHIRSLHNIGQQPDLLQKYIFTFHEEGRDISEFEFSNNMMFSNDITTLCFLYHILFKGDLKQCETVQILESLMFNKYEIDIEKNMDDPELTLKKITLIDVAVSFPSVTWDMICNFNLWTNFFAIFSDFNLPKVIFTPAILVLLPHSLAEEPPFAILLAIVLKTNEYRRAERLPLQTICNYISLSYNNQIFPERLKLELCKKWQILMVKKGVFKYTPRFTTHREKSKDITAKMVPDDPDLELILSKL